MSIIKYDQPLNVLLSVKGHPFERDAFLAVFEAMEGISVTAVEQPAAAQLMNPDGMAAYDALVLYDMPGLDFLANDPPRYVPPGPEVCAGIERLLQDGIGIVALHHAIAGWPSWDAYAESLGGRFLYKPAALLGRAYPDSGCRHDVTHEITCVMPDHPVLEGIPENYSLTDELYLYEVFEDDVVPLLRSNYQFIDRNFYSAAQAVAGTMYSNEGWSHPAGSNLVGWVKRAKRSPLVYLQFGDGPQTYADLNFRRLVTNAIRWVASPDAKAWAQRD